MAESSLNEQEYKHVTLQGVLCIVWNALQLPEDTKEADKLKTARRKLKDTVGKDNLDTFMLDTKHQRGAVGNEREYCDLILITEMIGAWEKCMTDYYKKMEYRIEKKTIRASGKVTGHRLSVANSLGTALATVSFYPGKDKIMVQPGDKEEDNLLQWIGNSKFYLQKVKDSSAELLPRDGDNSGTTNHHIPASDLRVVFPEEAGQGAIPKSLEKSRTRKSARLQEQREVIEESEEEADIPVIINELLCFINCKMSTVPKDILTSCCVHFYEADEIASSKKLLFEVVKPEGKRYISRRKTENKDKAKEDFKDIYEILLGNTTSKAVFVARDLSRLPSISMSDVDVGKIARDMEEMKINMTKLAKCQSDLQDIIKSDRQRRLLVKNTDRASTMQPSTNDGSVQASDCDQSSNSEDKPEGDAEALDSDTQSEAEYDTRSEAECSWSTSDSDHEDGREDQPPPLPVSYAGAATGRAADPTLAHDWQTRQSRNKRRQRRDLAANSDQDRNSTGHPTNNNKQSNGVAVVIGTGIGAGQLHAVPQKNAGHGRSAVNKTVTGVFATRFLPRTTSKQIERHIKQNTGLDIWVQKLITKYDDYCSFYLRARDRNTQSTLMSPDLWAKGILLKPYVE